METKIVKAMALRKRQKNRLSKKQIQTSKRGMKNSQKENYVRDSQRQKDRLNQRKISKYDA